MEDTKDLMRTDGMTRIVFVLRKVVIKIPNFTYSWQHFIKGILANINESETWRYNSGRYESGRSHLLCPVLWTSYGGWILIMKRADVDRHLQEVINSAPVTINSEEELKLRYQQWAEAGFGGDDKCDNYGYLDNRLVKIDYAGSEYSMV